MAKTYTDHLGNTFPTRKALAEHYGISDATLAYRLKNGLSMKEALTTPMRQQPVVIKDHLGNVFPTRRALAKHYNMSENTLANRLKRGLSIEEALNMPMRSQPIVIKDHLGNTFPSLKALAKYYNISETALKYRLKNKSSIEEILTTPVQKRSSHICVDHLGNIFPSTAAMIRHYNVTKTILKNRLKKGMSLEEALTTPVQKQAKTCTDHKGNTFRSIKQMAAFHNIPEAVVRRRIEKGIATEKALTEPVKIHKQKTYTDHLGNVFKSLDAMAAHHHINRATLRGRLKKGLSIEDALTKQSQQNEKTHIELFGHIYQTKDELATDYNMNTNTLKSRLSNKSSYTTTSQVVGITPSMFELSKFCIDNSDYYLYDFDGKKAVVTFDQIDQYHIEKYRKEHNII